MSAQDAARRLHVVKQVIDLPPEAFAEVEALVQSLLRAPPASPSKAPVHEARSAAPLIAELDWPHAPPHRLSEHGTYFVTTGTLYKQHFFRGPERLDYLQAELLSRAKNEGWQLEAWAIFSNHYHFVAHALPGATNLGVMLKELHRTTAIHLNRLDQTEGRQVWYNFRDTPLTFETSCYTRLAYVHNNPVKHGLVTAARLYRWCSAGWFERTATPAQVETMARIKTDAVKIYDDYEPVLS